MKISVSDKEENIAGKGENAGYQHFSPFPSVFSKGPFLRVVKPGIVWERVNPLPHNAAF